MAKLILYLKLVRILRIQTGFILGVVAVTGIDTERALALIGVGILASVLKSKIGFVILGAVCGALLATAYLSPPDYLSGRGRNFQIISRLNEGFATQRLVVSEGWQHYLVELPKHPPLMSGDSVWLEVEASRLIDPVKEGYLYSIGVISILGKIHYRVINNSESLISKGLGDVREYVYRYFTRSYNREAGSLGIGLLMGESLSGLDQEYEQNLIRSGLSHVVAVSGYNFGIIYLCLMTITSRLPRKIGLLLAACGMVVYFLWVGVTNIPAFRATIMALVAILLAVIGRKLNLYTTILWAVCVILGFSPTSWKSISFQLSLSALLGIVVLSKAFLPLLNRLPGLVKESLTATISATAATLPISVGTFGGLSIISLLANLFVIPIVPLAMFMCCVGLVINYLVPYLANFTNTVAAKILDLIVGTINTTGSWSFAYVTEIKVIVVYGIVTFGLWLCGDFLNFKASLNAKS